MRAVVVEYNAANLELSIGDEIEVLGFVFVPHQHHEPGLHAVWRDDQGYVWDIPVAAIRMLPNTTAAEVAA